MQLLFVLLMLMVVLSLVGQCVHLSKREHLEQQNQSLREALEVSQQQCQQVREACESQRIIIEGIDPDAVQLRGTGRSVGFALHALGTALLQPNQWVWFHDHCGSVPDYWMAALEPIIDNLRLAMDTQVCSRRGLGLRSTIVAARDHRDDDVPF